MTPLTLAPAGDDDFAWLLAGGAAARAGLTIAPGGLDDDIAAIRHVRAIAHRLMLEHEAGCWMMLAGNEVVGLIGFHRAPAADGNVEIGYNVAPSRRCRGYATAAVGAVIELAQADQRIRTITARTDPANVASQRALERNGFVRVAADPQGEILWRRPAKSYA